VTAVWLFIEWNLFDLFIDTDFKQDAQAIFERALKHNKDNAGKEDDKLYRGQTGYTQYIEKRDTAAGNASSGSVRYVG